MARSIIILATFPLLASALPPICQMLPNVSALPEGAPSRTGFHIDFKASTGIEISMRDATTSVPTPALQALRLMTPPNGTIPAVLKCVLGCVVPEVFAGLAIENFGIEGLVCMQCKAQKLDAEIEIQRIWAEAFAQRAVPQNVFGATGGTPVGSDMEVKNFMQLMTLDAAKRLSYERSLQE